MPISLSFLLTKSWSYHAVVPSNFLFVDIFHLLQKSGEHDDKTGQL